MFAWPGIGRLIVESILQRDFPVVQAAVTVFAALVIGVNLLIDFLYVVLDPRVKYEAAA